jgi:hypothetical protein
MSEERLRELSIRRRTFLKRGATAVFVAPILVSFGLDGTAEAGPRTVGNESFASSPPPLHDAEAELTPMLDWILNALARGRVRRDLASSLVRKLLGVLLDVAEKNTSSACMTLEAFVDEVKRESAHLPDGLACHLLDRAARAQRKLGCGAA